MLMRKTWLSCAFALLVGATVYLSAQASKQGQTPPIDEKTFVFTNRPPAPEDVFGLWRESDLTVMGTVTELRQKSIPIPGGQQRVAARIFTISIAESFGSGTKRGPGAKQGIDVLVMGGEQVAEGKRVRTEASDAPSLSLNESYLMFLQWDEPYQSFVPAFGQDSVVPVHGNTFDITSRTPELRRHLTLYADLESLLAQLRVYR
jgi:hypothetical protein